MDIFHVYWGTSGNAGLYLDEIYQTLKKGGFVQKAYVSYYFPFNYGKKIFFRRTDLGHTQFCGKIREGVRLIELIIALIGIFVDVLIEKPKILNYSLIGSYYPVYVFLLAIKKITRSKLIITCHDVLPFGSAYINMPTEQKRRKRIFDLSDYLLVHNKNSKEDLYAHYNVDVNKIVEHPFPLMDLRKICGSTIEKNKFDFLFIGHLRVEKGFVLLLKAWEEFHKINSKASLCIAGNLPSSFSELNIGMYEKINVTFHLNYLSDSDYYKFITSSSCIVFPYLSGTNSGVIYTVLPLGNTVITSDISMFKVNPLISDENMFVSNNITSLVQLLERYVDKKLEDTQNKLQQYKQDFETQTILIYSRILK
jgi:glycosyltransferase involved in cell wall biosynthesis